MVLNERIVLFLYPDEMKLQLLSMITDPKGVVLNE